MLGDAIKSFPIRCNDNMSRAVMGSWARGVGEKDELASRTVNRVHAYGVCSSSDNE